MKRILLIFALVLSVMSTWAASPFKSGTVFTVNDATGKYDCVVMFSTATRTTAYVKTIYTNTYAFKPTESVYSSVTGQYETVNLTLTFNVSNNPFAGNTTLTSVDLSLYSPTEDYTFGLEGVTGSYGTFKGCTNLSTLFVNEHCVGALDQTFYGCTNLTSVEQVTASGSKPHCFKVIGKQAFYNCTSLKTFSFTETDSIAENAFAYSGLRSVYLGNNKKEQKLMSNCFSNLKNINVVIEDNGPLTCDTRVFANTTFNLIWVYDKKTIPAKLFSYLGYGATIPLQSTNITISDLAFAGNVNMKFIFKGGNWPVFANAFRDSFRDSNIESASTVCASYDTFKSIPSEWGHDIEEMLISDNPYESFITSLLANYDEEKMDLYINNRPSWLFDCSGEWTVYAMPAYDYVFKKWSDGLTDEVRTIRASDGLTPYPVIVPDYERIAISAKVKIESSKPGTGLELGGSDCKTKIVFKDQTGNEVPEADDSPKIGCSTFDGLYWFGDQTEARLYLDNTDDDVYFDHWEFYYGEDILPAATVAKIKDNLVETVTHDLRIPLTDKETVTFEGRDETFVLYPLGIQAVFKEKAKLTISPNNENWGSVNSAVNGRYANGTNVTITATPAAHYRFVRWSDDNTEATRTITMGTEDVELVAYFEEVPKYEITGAFTNADEALVEIFSNTGGRHTSPFYEGDNVLMKVSKVSDACSTPRITVEPNDFGVKYIAQNYEYDITLTADKHYVFTVIYDSVTVVTKVADEFADKVTLSGAGRYCLNSNASLSVTINDEHIEFERWEYKSLDRSGSIYEPTSIMMLRTFDGDVFTCEAIFRYKTYTLTVNANDNALGTVTGGGSYQYNKVATLTATPTTGNRFVRWNDGNTENPRTVTVTADATYTAEFEAIPVVKYTLTVASADESKGTVSGGGTYEEGTVIALTATAKDGYHFTKWNDGNTDNPRSVTVTANATYIANFEANVVEKDKYTITVLSTDESKGTVSGGGTYEEGTVIALTATAKEGYHFTKWNDGNTDNPRTVTVTADATYTAEFEAVTSETKTYTVTLIANPIEGGSLLGAGTYNEGATAIVGATAAEGYEFVGWNDGVSEAVRQIVVNGDIILIGNFRSRSEGINDVQGVDAPSTKIVRNGQILILRDGKAYTILGTRVRE